MCGIAGLLEPEELQSRSAATLDAMLDAIAHRGPDGSGQWLDDAAGVAIGHRRLAVIDPSDAGHQPMVSRSGRYVISFNGEIYNFEDLRTEIETSLGAICWRGHSDTEVLLEAIEVWGVHRTLPKLNGMFAFAVWDRANQMLTLARDRVGEKPLYYGKVGRTFVFGSELKALQRHPSFDRRVDEAAVAMMLRYDYIPAPHSIWHGISKLEQGHSLQVDRKGAVGVSTPYRSGQGALNRARTDLDPIELVDPVSYLDGLLRKAVKRRMVADVPLGAFLSGGIDSSLIVALMQVQRSNPVTTFTIGFDEPRFDEAPYAKKISDHLGTNHNEVYVTADDALGVIPKLPLIWDEPFGDVSAIPTFLVSSIARSKVKVTLAGDGGDELFGGYSRYQTVAAVEKFTRHVPRSAARLLNDVIRRARSRAMIPGHAGRLARMIAAASPEALYGWSVSRLEEPCRFVRNSAGRDAPLSDLVPFLSHFQEKMMWADFMYYLPDNGLVKVDRAAMAVGLEVRVPFLDLEVVDYAQRLPTTNKIREGSGKAILKDVLKRYVPDTMFERPKMGFSIPIEAWLKGRLRDWAESLLDERHLRETGILEPKMVRALWCDFLAGKRRHHRPIWNLLMVQAWAEQMKLGTPINVAAPR